MNEINVFDIITSHTAVT